MAIKYKYKTILLKGPQNGIFAEFPFDSVSEFGTRKPVAVNVAFDGYSVQMNLLPRGNNNHWLHVKKEIRNAIGKEEGDLVEISIEKNDSPKEVVVPDYLQWLLENEPQIKRAFDKAHYSAQKFWIEYIQETGNEEIKVDRINRFFQFLQK